MTITITLTMIKWFGLVLAVLSILCLFGGSLPGHVGNSGWDTTRKVIWPAMLIWFVYFLGRGLLL